MTQDQASNDSWDRTYADMKGRRKVEFLKDYKGNDIGVSCIEVPGGMLYHSAHGLCFVPREAGDALALLDALQAIMVNLGMQGANADVGHPGRASWLIAREAISSWLAPKAARQ